jgi:hypothetical protein
MRLERVIKNLRDFQLWWFFTLGPRGVYFIIIFLCFSVGPDQLFPADSYTTTSATGAVKLKIDERGMASIPPLSVPTLLQRTVARHMDHPALCVKRDGKVYTRAIKRIFAYFTVVCYLKFFNFPFFSCNHFGCVCQLLD